MKVKKFRIKPRLSSVGRILKSLMGVKQLPVEMEERLAENSQQFASGLVPLAFYQTWSHQIPSMFKPVLASAGIGKPIAVSALVATIGAPPEDLLSETLMKGETLNANLLTALSEESADLAFNFVYRLLVDDAKSDDCEVSEPFPITTEPMVGEVLALMDAAQEGVIVDQAGHISPRFTRIALAAWTPVSKRKRPALSQKKRAV